MTLRYRAMRPSDVHDCVRILGAHPILAPRYGEILGDLPKVLLSLLGRDAFIATVFLESHGGSSRILGAGIGCFVLDNFLSELKKPPFFWAVPELVRRHKRGQSPILSDQEVRNANSGQGLSLFVWHTGLSIEELRRPEAMHIVPAAFMENFRGYRLKELLQQAESWEQLGGTRAAGGHFVSPSDGRYSYTFDAVEADVAAEPLMCGMTRELTYGPSGGSWVASLFQYQPPRLCFNRSEQALLRAALCGGTDEELRDELRVSLSAVKKTWRAIYDRVASSVPELVPSHADLTHYRGKAKKQRLIAYLRDHPEELRPISRKQIRQRP
jgi:hypothetical protein